MQYNPDGAMLGYVHSFCDGIRANYQVDPRHYVTDTIKRGLRNADGTGVLVGATGIGSVQGYMMLDGEPIPMPGRLYYRGIDLREIVGAHIDEEIFGFEEVSYLLLLGKLPTRAELAAWGEALSITRELPDGFDRDILLAAPSSSVMNMLSRAVEALYAYDSAPDDTSLENMVRQSIELISRVPVIVAHAFSIKRNTFDGEPLKLYTPQTDKSLAENFLHMLRSGDHYSPEEARLLDLLLTIHAEHGGGTSSAFACRLLASAGSDVYGAVASAINVVKGPMDGGACLLVKRMFEDICENVPDMDDAFGLSKSHSGRRGGRRLGSHLRAGARGLHAVRPARAAAQTGGVRSCGKNRLLGEISPHGGRRAGGRARDYRPADAAQTHLRERRYDFRAGL